MKLVYYFIYNPFVNSLLRPVSKFFHNLTGKKLMAVSGDLGLKLHNVSFKLRANQSSFVSQELYYNGTENYEFTKLFADLIQTEKIFFDIGANIGYFSVLGSKLNPGANIFAFEPSIGSLHYLEQNVEINGCSNVTIIDKAVSDMEGTLPFHEVTNQKFPWLKHNLNGSNSLEKRYISNEFRTYNVQLTTIEKVMHEHGLTGLDLVKLDTECTEHLILSCSAATIDQHRPIIISEVYPVIEKEVQDIFQSQISGYETYQYIHDSNRLRKIGSFFEINTNDEDRNFVFCPVEKRQRLSAYFV